MQPRRSAPEQGDDVTAAGDCGRLTAIVYSRLATRLRSPAIISHIHLYLLSLESTFATIYHNYHTYAYKAKRWRMCPYNLVLPSATTLSNICRRVYALTVDAIKKQLPLRNTVSLALEGWTSTNKLAITLVIAYYMDRNWALREVQLTFDEAYRLLCSRSER